MSDTEGFAYFQHVAHGGHRAEEILSSTDLLEINGTKLWVPLISECCYDSPLITFLALILTCDKTTQKQ